jgi:hypothetical protein
MTGVDSEAANRQLEGLIVPARVTARIAGCSPWRDV